VSLPRPYRPLRFDGPHHPFIVLEGVSGIGKSTLAWALADRLGATSLHTLPTPHAGWSTLINERLRALPQFAFYLSGLLHAADSIRLARATGPVVADRYASSVVACHAAVHEVAVEEAARLLEPFRPYLETPTRTYYLGCSEPGRLARLLANFRTVQAADPTAVALDTDGKSPDDLADWIIADLEAQGA
jgi:dTMP kinase